MNGERNPTDVYNDFRSSVLQILSAHQGPVHVVVPNGVVRANDDAVLGVDDAVDAITANNASDPATANHDAQPTTYPRVICVVGE